MVGLVAESLGQSFEAHLTTFLPLFSHCLHMQHDYNQTNEGEGLVSMGPNSSEVVINNVTLDGNTDVNSGGGSGGNCANEEGLTHDIETESEEAVVDERSLDHFLFGLVQCLCKIFKMCAVMRSPVYRHTVNCILGETDTHTHTHTPILTHTHTHTSS